jgi:hypothetical protein
VELGGLYFAPLLGSPDAIANEKAQRDYTWLRSRQYYFFMQAIYGLLMVLGFLAWLRDQTRHMLLWITVFACGFIFTVFLVGLRLPFSFNFAIGWLQPMLSLRDIALWFLQLYLLKLDENKRLARFTRIIAIISILSASIDWSDPAITAPEQLADAVLIAIFTILELYPLVPVGFALRKRLDLTRCWWPSPPSSPA